MTRPRYIRRWCNTHGALARPVLLARDVLDQHRVSLRRQARPTKQRFRRRWVGARHEGATVEDVRIQSQQLGVGAVRIGQMTRVQPVARWRRRARLTDAAVLAALARRTHRAAWRCRRVRTPPHQKVLQERKPQPVVDGHRRAHKRPQLLRVSSHHTERIGRCQLQGHQTLRYQRFSRLVEEHLPIPRAELYRWNGIARARSHA